MGSSVSRVLGNFQSEIPQIEILRVCLICVRSVVAQERCTRPRGEGTPRHVAVFGSSLLLAFSIGDSSGAAAAFSKA